MAAVVLLSTMVLMLLLASSSLQAAVVVAQSTNPTPGIHNVPSRVKLCYMLFAGVDDLGYTYRFNLGRIAAEVRLREKYPSLTIVSEVVTGMLFKSDEEADAERARLIRTGCEIILSNAGLGPDTTGLANNFTNVTFGTVSTSRLGSLAAMNVIYFAPAIGPMGYVAGAGAAAQASRCVGVISAQKYSTAMDYTNGVTQGVHSVKPTMPVHVVTTNSWYNPSREVDAAKQIRRLGCEVILRYTDPRDVDLYVQRDTTDTLTVGAHANLQEFVGDAVMTSAYLDWQYIVFPIVDEWLQSPSNPRRVDITKSWYLRFDSGVTQLGKLSARSNVAIVAPVMNAALARFTSSSTLDVYCDRTLRLTDGRSLGDYIPAGQQCTTPGSRPSGAFLVDSAFTTFHPDFLSATTCLAGSFAVYHVFSLSDGVTPNITLQCVPCPANTFSSDSGARSCTQCPNGTFSEVGAETCISPGATESSTNIALIIGIIVPLLIIAVVLIVVALLYPKVAKHLARANCPQPGKPFAAVFFTFKDESLLRERYAEDWDTNVIPHLRSKLQEAVQKNSCYEARKLGDCTFLVVATTSVRALKCASHFRRLMRQTNWASLCPHGPVVGISNNYARKNDDNISIASATSESEGIRNKKDNNTAMKKRRNTKRGAPRYIPQFSASAGVCFGEGRVTFDELHDLNEYSGDCVKLAAAVCDRALHDVILCDASCAEDATETAEGDANLYTTIDFSGNKHDLFLFDSETASRPTIDGGKNNNSDSDGGSSVTHLESGEATGVSASLEEQSTGVITKTISIISIFIPELTNEAQKHRLPNDVHVDRATKAFTVIAKQCKANRAFVESFVDGRFTISINFHIPASRVQARGAVCAMSIVEKLRELDFVCYAGVSSGHELVGKLSAKLENGNESVVALLGTVALTARMLEQAHRTQSPSVLACCVGAFASEIDMFAVTQALDFFMMPAVPPGSSVSPRSRKPVLHKLVGLMMERPEAADEWMYELEAQENPYNAVNHVFSMLESQYKHTLHRQLIAQKQQQQSGVGQEPTRSAPLLHQPTSSTTDGEETPLAVTNHPSSSEVPSSSAPGTGVDRLVNSSGGAQPLLSDSVLAQAQDSVEAEKLASSQNLSSSLRKALIFSGLERIQVLAETKQTCLEEYAQTRTLAMALAV